MHAKMKLKTVLSVSRTEKYTDNVRDLFSPAFTRDIRSGLGTKICLQIPFQFHTQPMYRPKINIFGYGAKPLDASTAQAVKWPT